MAEVGRLVSARNIKLPCVNPAKPKSSKSMHSPSFRIRASSKRNDFSLVKYWTTSSSYNSELKFIHFLWFLSRFRSVFIFEIYNFISWYVHVLPARPRCIFIQLQARHIIYITACSGQFMSNRSTCRPWLKMHEPFELIQMFHVIVLLFEWCSNCEICSPLQNELG